MKTGISIKRWLTRAILPVAAACSLAAQAAEPLKIGYSDWPGWVALQVAIDKGWFKDAGVDVKFEWFDYSASMDAFAAGKLDAVTMTNGDALVTGAGGLVGSRTTELLLGAGVRVVGIDCLLRAARAGISRVLRSSTTSS